jgi:hypothetical protein
MDCGGEYGLGVLNAVSFREGIREQDCGDVGVLKLLRARRVDVTRE